MSNRTIPAIGLADGAALISAAVLAPELGLDSNPGWGTGRIVLLCLGLLFVVLSASVLWFGDRRPDFLQRMQGSAPLNTTALVGHLWLVVLLIYIWFITYGQWWVWNHTTSYYDRLANSFLAGHLYIDSKPDAALLAAPSPYTPGSRPPIQNNIWDMSLYQGKFYLYWGPVPAVLLAPLKFLTGRKIADNYLVFFYYAALLVINSLIILKLWKRLYPNVPAWLVFPCIPLVGLISPIVWSLSEPNIYNAAVGAAQFFFMGGIFCAILAFDREESVSRGYLTLAGLFWVGAVGTRALYAITIIPATLLTFRQIMRHNGTRKGPNQLPVWIASLAAPLFLGAMALGWYNWARFGSPFEFGLRYQITIWDLNKLYPALFLPAYFFSNLLVYVFQPFQFIPRFPYIEPTLAADFFRAINFAPPPLYYAGRFVGLFFSTPIALLGFSYFLHTRAAPSIEGGEAARSEISRFVHIVLLSSLVSGFLLLLLFFVGSERYLVDVVSPLCLLVVLAIWRGHDLGFQTPALGKRFFAGIASVFIYLSMIFGILFGFSAETNPLQSQNPALFNLIAHFLPVFK